MFGKLAVELAYKYEMTFSKKKEYEITLKNIFN
jgi:hypothetical protein